VTTWQTIIAWLAALSADPAEIDRERPKAAAAVAVAYASMAPETLPTPAPVKACACGGTCKGTGIYRPDGRVEMKCEPGCKTCTMKSVLAAECRCGGKCSGKCSCGCQCPDGKCPKNSPAPGR